MILLITTCIDTNRYNEVYMVALSTETYSCVPEKARNMFLITDLELSTTLYRNIYKMSDITLYPFMC